MVWGCCRADDRRFGGWSVALVGGSADGRTVAAVSYILLSYIYDWSDASLLQSFGFQFQTAPVRDQHAS